MLPTVAAVADDRVAADEPLFAGIAQDLQERGFSIQPGAIPEYLTAALYEHTQMMSQDKFVSAGIGRQQDFMTNQFVRKDEICWITGNSAAGVCWQQWAEKLKAYLNRRLYLGLFSFESHFAHYSPGDFYKRHLDAFKGEANRVLSIVLYLNPHWQIGDAGELVLYRDAGDAEGIRVLPTWSTLVVFLSEDFPHEVLPANRDRYSVAGWFRVNTSVATRVDPPT